MFGSKVKVRKEILERAESAAAKLGSSVEEFVERCIQIELDRIESEQAASSGSGPSDAEVDEIMGKLKGLGYID